MRFDPSIIRLAQSITFCRCLGLAGASRSEQTASSLLFQHCTLCLLIDGIYLQLYLYQGGFKALYFLCFCEA